jgi:signal transduction histidine kinase
MDGDAVRLSQVFGNLLANAAKFASRGGRAEISIARVAPGTAVVCVRDDGVGIAPELQGRLFEPFAQGPDTLARSRGGLGLGLALAKGLVDLHEGTIAARRGAGVGTEIVVSLPLLPQEEELPAVPAVSSTVH